MSKGLFEQEKDPWRQWATRIAVIVVIGAVLVAGGWAVIKVARSCGGVTSGITTIGGECVGMTDGSFDFDPSLAGVDRLIKKENDRVAAEGGNYVKVALLNPLTQATGAPMTPAVVLHAVEGAYLAQLVENRSPTLTVNDDRGGTEAYPQTQLMLVNEGSHENQWQPAVHAIEGGVGGAHPIVGVIGLGVSLPQTLLAGAELSRHQIPMVGGALSADGLDAKAIPGLLNVSPSNSDYVAALAGYLAHDRPDVTSAMLVADSNNDLYTKTLGADFAAQFQDVQTLPATATTPAISARPGLVTAPIQYFQGQTIGAKGEPALFTTVMNSICIAKPKVILFAGRTTDLKTFDEELDARTCPQLPIVVMTGGTGLSDALLTARDRENHISMIFSTSDAAEQWAAGTRTPGGYLAFLHSFDDQFPMPDVNRPAALDDGYAIMYNDAMRTLAKAVKISMSGNLRTAVPERQRILVAMRNLSIGSTVAGASGTLTFSGAHNGRAGGKPVPVMRTTPAGGTEMVDVYVTPDR